MSTLLRTLAPLASGLVFGLGLIAAGMTDPAKVLAFLDLAGAWDPSRIRTELAYPALEMRPAQAGLWSVGGIVQPDEATMSNPPAGHLASRLALLVIDRLAREEREEGQSLPEKQ
jgi:hypothetical protein